MGGLKRQQVKFILNQTCRIMKIKRWRKAPSLGLSRGVATQADKNYWTVRPYLKHELVNKVKLTQKRYSCVPRQPRVYRGVKFSGRGDP